MKKHGLFLELIYVRRVFYGVTPSRADLTPADARPASYRRIRQDPAMGSTGIGKKPAKVVARLGRRGRRGDDADDGQGGVRHTPLNAAWAILQAYAIIAIATSSYGSIFASPPPPPEQSAVRPPNPRARPARSNPSPPSRPGDAPTNSQLCVFFTQPDGRSSIDARCSPRPASPSPFRDEQMLNLTNVKNVLFGDGVLEDIHNVDRFLGVSTTSYHLSRLTCRKTLDAVTGTAKAAKYAAWYATDGAIDLAAPLAAEYAEAMMIPEAWANLKSSLAYTNRGVANCLRISWTVVGPPLRYALPFLDFVWDGLEPPLIRAKDAVVDAADDAMYTFKESFNEAMGPTVDEWGRALTPIARAPANAFGAFLTYAWRPAVYFCTYPELYGDLPPAIPPTLPRSSLRWGERCRKTLWGEWTACSARCGSGYRQRVNHCGKKQVIRCEGPGIIGCDEVCDSGAVRDCAGRCKGDKRVDCKGVCGGGAEVGCDGGCSYAAAQTDKSGACCAFPSFVLPKTGLCNTTIDEDTERLAQALAAKRRLLEDRAMSTTGALPERFATDLRERRRLRELAERSVDPVSPKAKGVEPIRPKKYPGTGRVQPPDDSDVVENRTERLLGTKRYVKVRPVRDKNAERGVFGSVFAFVAWPFRLVGWLVASVLGLLLTRVLLVLVLIGGFGAGAYHVVNVAIQQMESELRNEGGGDENDAGEEKPSGNVVDEILSKLVDLAKTAIVFVREWSDKRAVRARAMRAEKKERERVTHAHREAFGSVVTAASDADAYAIRRRAIRAMVTMSGSPDLEWRHKLRCFNGLVRLANGGSNRPYLIAEMGGLEEATKALSRWMRDKSLDQPHSALQLIRALVHAPAAQRMLANLDVVRDGTSAAVMLELLLTAPGVVPLQRSGLASLWALIHLAGPGSGVAEKLLDAGLFEHLEDEWEDSHADEVVAHGIGGCVMQLAKGDARAQARLTELGAQALVSKIFDEHPGVTYRGRFSDLRAWLRAGK